MFYLSSALEETFRNFKKNLTIPNIHNLQLSNCGNKDIMMNLKNYASSQTIFIM